MRAWLLNIGASVAYVAGGVCMKSSQGFTKLWPSVALFGLFCAGAALQTLAMRDAPMGQTYVLVLGLESILAFAAGFVFFSEPAGANRLIAVALIVAGIILLKAR